MTVTAAPVRQELLQISEAQHVLGNLSRPVIYRLIESGDIVRVHIGRRALITRDSIDAYLERQIAAAT